MNKEVMRFAIVVFCSVCVCISDIFACEGRVSPEDSSDFVEISKIVPEVILDVRYYSQYNFVGNRITGYEEPCGILTREAAEALKEVSDDLMMQGYKLLIYDAYRPQMAVDCFVEWAKDEEDTCMKAYFYPEIEKDELFLQGYIATKSSHSRGSTVDLTLYDIKAEKELDMGGTFDYFGRRSHPDWCGNPETGEYEGSLENDGITAAQFKNRMILRNAMIRHGFNPIDTEWWHFTFDEEPYPDTYFSFPVKRLVKQK